MKEKLTNSSLKGSYPITRPKLSKSEIQAGEKMLKKYITAWMKQPEMTDEEKEKISQENLRLMKKGQEAQKRIAAEKLKKQKQNSLKGSYPMTKPKLTKSELEETESLKKAHQKMMQNMTKSDLEEHQKRIVKLKEVLLEWINGPELTDQEKEKIRQENLKIMKKGNQALKRIAAAKEKAKKRKEKKILHHSKIDYTTEKGIEMIYRDHLKNFLPKMYKEMTDQDFQEQAERVHQDVQKQKQEIMKDGTPEMLALMQAWELNRERILIDPEQDEDE